MREKNDENIPEVSIGLPVYNGERQIRNALDSLLLQTFTDFELIISNNASTDETESICKEYAKKDKRIKEFYQSKNTEILENFNFVLEKANGKYFMWAGADDVWHPEFIRKNLEMLKSDNNAVGSISEIQFFNNEWTKQDTERFSNTEVKKKYELVHPITGNYEDKVNFVFTFNHPQCIYGLFKTTALKKSIVKKRFGSVDYAIILNLLKHGNLLVVNELLMYMYRGHKKNEKKELLFKSQRRQNFGLISSLFPFVSLTVWCARNLGIKIFLKNIPRFIKMNYRAERLVLIEKLFTRK